MRGGYLVQLDGAQTCSHMCYFWLGPISGHSCTLVRGSLVALHVSRYTGRHRFPGVFMCSNGITLHPALQGPAAPVARQLPGVSHVLTQAASPKVSCYKGV